LLSGVALCWRVQVNLCRERTAGLQHKRLQFWHGFKVVLGDEHSQAAQMTLAPGEAVHHRVTVSPCHCVIFAAA
jgi:hypothetical protein